MSDPSSRTVLVTGGSSGIGRGIALAFAREGFATAITYGHHRENAEESARLIEQAGGKPCVIIPAVMEQEAAPVQAVREAVERLGHLDVLVNNAGRTMFGDILTMSLETLNHLIDLDFKSYILAMQAAANHMKNCEIRGAIINIASARAGRAHPGDAVYGGLKKALERATESVALDLAPYGIRVNTISPGATLVRDLSDRQAAVDDFCRRIPLGRMALPEDIGHAAVFLASDKASYITGQTLYVDGGLNLPGMPEMERGKLGPIGNWAVPPAKGNGHG